MGAWLVRAISFHNITLQDWMVIAFLIVLVATVFVWRTRH
jgi:hypothetical protein